jgi:catechol 2,3-dioxygenase-like lactoylglutathione lyase family enzyme
MPALAGILETALYVADLDLAARFYEEVIGLQRLDGDARFRAYAVAGHDVLLLFKQGDSSKAVRLPGGIIPPHDGFGQNHFAFAIEASELPAWEEQLARCGVAIESRVRWPRGGVSIYFRDPHQNLLELATRGIWVIY